jgi:hypothetical protein
VSETGANRGAGRDGRCRRFDAVAPSDGDREDGVIEGRGRDEAERDGSVTRPAAMCRGRGHLIVYGNRAFLLAFGTRAVGLPAREGLVGLPPEAFGLLDTVFDGGRALACWLEMGGERWRMTAAPRVDPMTGEVYGVSFHLRARSDVPIVPDRAPRMAEG